jgi:hypothetical protein
MGQLELDTISGASPLLVTVSGAPPMLANGEPLHEGNHHQVAFADLVEVVVGRPNGLGEETQRSNADGVGEAMTCLICISTVLARCPRTPCSIRAAL